MNKVSFKQLTTIVAFIGLGFSTVDAGAVGGTITGQIVNAKTGEMICALALINGQYKTYSCIGDDNRGAPFTLPYDYATNSSNNSANKLLVFASGYTTGEQLITQPNQSVKIDLTKISDLGGSSSVRSCPLSYSNQPVFKGQTGQVALYNEWSTPVKVVVYHSVNGAKYIEQIVNPGQNNYIGNNLIVGDDWGICVENIQVPASGVVLSVGSVSNYSNNLFMVQNIHLGGATR